MLLNWIYSSKFESNNILITLLIKSIMKKILILLAATMLLFACGGNSGKKSEKQTVEETAVNYLKKLMKAQDAYDYQAAEKIYAEMQEWYEGLSAADKKKADNAAEKLVDGEYEEDEEYYEEDEEYYEEDEEYYDEDDEDDEDWDDEDW